MLQIIVKENDFFDEKTSSFIHVDEQILDLEHSLVSISKWESKWNKSFINTKNFSVEESIDYIRCMTLNEDVNPLVYFSIDDKNVNDVMAYIEAPMTATTIHRSESKPSREIITSELIYYWMIVHNIPFECQHWHLNRLLTLIDVCNIKNSPKKKMAKKDIFAMNRELNEQRKKMYNTRG